MNYFDANVRSGRFVAQAPFFRLGPSKTGAYFYLRLGAHGGLYREDELLSPPIPMGANRSFWLVDATKMLLRNRGLTPEIHDVRIP
jgi:hypothetical protein